MARTDYYGIQTPVLQATSQAIRTVNGTVGTIAPEDYPDLISAMHSQSDYDNVMAQLVEETTTPASIASFTDGANNLPVKELICTINPTETGTGTKSPQNPYVIGGHSEINVTNANKAIVSDIYTIEPIQDGTGTPSPTNKRPIHPGLTITRDDESTLEVYGGGLNIKTGELSVTWGFKVFDGTESWGTENPYNFYSQSGRGSGGQIISGSDVICSHAPSIEANWRADFLNCYISQTGNFNIQIPTEEWGIPHTGADMKSWVSLQYANGTPLTVIYPLVTPLTIQLSATELERAKAALGITTHTADFGQTVYGGSLNATTGVLTITHTYYKTTGNEDFKQQTYNGMNGVWVFDILPYTGNRPPYVSNMSTYSIPTLYQSGSLWCGVNSNNLYWIGILDILEMTLEEFKVWIVNNPLEVAYELRAEDRFEIQLDPIEVRTLLGSNNIYHDCNGDIEVTYRANGALYVAQH